MNKPACDCGQSGPLLAAKGRATTVDQKRAIVEALYAAWSVRPSERLGQLISNALHNVEDIYYVEDRALVSAVDRYVER